MSKAKTKRKIRSATTAIFTIIAVLVVIYLLMSVYVTVRGQWIVTTINDHYGVWDAALEKELDGCISEELAVKYVNYKTSGCLYNESEWSSYDEWRNSFIQEYSSCGNFFGYLTLGGAEVNYRYSQHNISAIDGSVIPNGGMNIPCKLYMKLVNFKWTVVDYYEAP